MIRLIVPILMLLLFIQGCDSDLFNKKKLDSLNAENEKLKTSIAAQKEQLKTELEKEKLNKQTELQKEQLKTQAEIKKAQIEAKRQKELELIRQKTLLEQEKQKKELLVYLMLLAALLMLIISFFIYLHFKRKREDKLRAYEDNLKKYFLLKENEMKLQMAQKILETIEKSSLSSEDQKKLIAVLHEHNETTIEMIEHK